MKHFITLSTDNGSFQAVETSAAPAHYCILLGTSEITSAVEQVRIWACPLVSSLRPFITLQEGPPGFPEHPSFLHTYLIVDMLILWSSRFNSWRLIPSGTGQLLIKFSTCKSKNHHLHTARLLYHRRTARSRKSYPPSKSNWAFISLSYITPQQPPLRLLCSWRSCLHLPDSDAQWVHSLVGCHLLHSPPCHPSQQRKTTEALLTLTEITRVKLLWSHRLPQARGIKDSVLFQRDSNKK